VERRETPVKLQFAFGIGLPESVDELAAKDFG